MINNRTDMTVNLTNAVLGGILFLSPWLLGFSQETWAALNARLSGGIVVLLALLALIRTHDWEEWLNVMAGLWIAGAPWLLWFENVLSARWTHVIIGFCIVAMAAFELYRLYSERDDMISPRGRSR
ncbi:SPW repeat protein [Microvirga sp. VF16]|uniref:SPW repeat protein n=1 Tax=Microvirga sp. VF16 TaxID=2807101 RepID=UPI00193E692B|nr:SPW repeat protein [Microvirga sp. VF16]QRM30210.1 SPW repeat protein [Microvirga sp. VF16]